MWDRNGSTGGITVRWHDDDDDDDDDDDNDEYCEIINSENF